MQARESSWLVPEVDIVNIVQEMDLSFNPQMVEKIVRRYNSSLPKLVLQGDFSDQYDTNDERKLEEQIAHNITDDLMELIKAVDPDYECTMDDLLLKELHPLSQEEEKNYEVIRREGRLPDVVMSPDCTVAVTATKNEASIFVPNPIGIYRNTGFLSAYAKGLRAVKDR